MTLFWQHFKAQLTGLLIWVVSCAAFTLLITRSASGFLNQGGIAQYLKGMPSYLQAIYGAYEGLSPLDAYIGLGMEKMTGAILGLYAALLALSVVTREMDRRTIEFLLALPVQRAQVLLARAVVMAVNTLAVVAAMWAVIRVDLASQGLDGSWGLYALMFFGLWLLSLAIGGITLLLSLWIDDYSLGVKLFSGVVVAAYFAEFVLRAAGVSRWARALSPFSYMQPVEVLHHGGLPTADALVLATLAVVTVAAAIPVFNRKQIAA